VEEDGDTGSALPVLPVLPALGEATQRGLPRDVPLRATSRLPGVLLRKARAWNIGSFLPPRNKS